MWYPGQCIYSDPDFKLSNERAKKKSKKIKQFTFTLFASYTSLYEQGFSAFREEFVK